MRWWPAWLLVGAALLALGTRFLDRELVSYVLDEPQLQDAAVRDARSGHWASISVLRGTRGVRYGPAPLWFYTAIHRVAGPRPEAGILGAGFFLTLCPVLLCWGLARRSEARPLVLGTALAVVAASPFAFLWSRQGWDNSLLAGIAALAVVALAISGPVRPVRAAALGVLLGLALDTHLMAIPFTVAVLVVLGTERRALRDRLLSVGAAIAAAALVLLPYALALAHEPRASAAASAAGPGERVVLVLEALLAPFSQLTGLGMDYFIDPEWQDFLHRSSPAASLGVLGPVLAGLAAAAAVLGMLLGRRAESPGVRRVARLGLWTWILHAAFLGLLALPREPHYQQPVLWIPVAGWALAVAGLWPRRPAVAAGLCALAALTGLWGVTLQRSWMGWIRGRGGTRGIHYGLTLGAQRRAIAEACSAPSRAVALQLQTVTFPHSLLSLARTEPACQDHRLELCAGRCPRLPPGWAVATLRYAGAGAQLAPVHPEVLSDR